MEQAKQTFLEFFRKEKLLNWVVALGVCGMLLIYLSSLWTPEGEEPAPPADAGTSAEYSLALESSFPESSPRSPEKNPPPCWSLWRIMATACTLRRAVALPSRERPPARRVRPPMSFLRTPKATNSPDRHANPAGSARGRCGQRLRRRPGIREKLVTAVCTALDLSSAKVCVTSADSRLIK